MMRNYVIRWSFFMIGLAIMALGITLTIKGQKLGISPWDVLHVGLFQQFGLTVGSWSIIMGILIITVLVIMTKKPPRVGAILNMVLVGVFIDFFNWLLPEPASWTGIVVVFLLGIVAMGYGVGIYVSADMGTGPRDSVMMLLVEKTGWKISRVRRGLDIVVLAAGFGLGGPVGIGTIITALFVGTIVHLSLPQSTIVLNRLLDRKQVIEGEHLASKKA
ncbi:YczE/YyaS/YitT family protein [Jeotgalibacillus proteolyticus]|uniref:YitT family protein n=1 Tax=Jeotgalibacillus proteolyticus TaxID=2082395 RepID=A0A2S5G9Z2_9BACL|nr:YitT family protein [Jeotgalibacillus proteolyticus]PPA69733.1 hypothetical protein C4B60_14430 [Jeotgalibacillus proteolyticus]